MEIEDVLSVIFDESKSKWKIKIKEKTYSDGVEKFVTLSMSDAILAKLLLNFTTVDPQMFKGE